MFFDLTRLVGRYLEYRLPTGIDRVSLAYLGHYRSKAKAFVRVGNRWVFLDAAGSGKVFDALLGTRVLSPRSVRWTIAKDYWPRGKGVPSSGLLLNTGHSGVDESDYAEKASRLGLKPVFFLHDLIPITHPEFNRPGEAERHRRRLATMVEAGRGIIVNSVATKMSVEQYSAEAGWLLPPIVVAPLAPTALEAPHAPSPLAEPYFVVLGTIEPRKNHLILLHVWRQLAYALGAATPKLVIVGQRGWECEQVIDILERCTTLRDFVLEFPRCSDTELASLLSHARALLFPSFVEGYGLPLVEAMRLRVPVIASDLPVFRELAGEAPEYLDPIDGPAWRKTILDYIPNGSARRNAQLKRMENLRVPGWEDHFAIVDEFLKGIA